MKTVIEIAKEVGYPIMVFDGKPYVCPELERLVTAVRADERSSWPAEMEAMERQVNILTDALAAEREKWMERTAILIRGEREACAKVADEWSKRQDDVGGYISRNIRARSNT
jgi:hypothetical protein